MSSTGTMPDGPSPSKLRYIPLSYNTADSEKSALRLVLSVHPEWEGSEGPIEFTRFTDGITNTLLKIAKKYPGWTEEQIDNGAVLMRAYGNNTEILIDRDREAKSHSLLAERGLAPELLARFHNGLLYKFIRGQVCTPKDLTTEPVWRGVAKRLAEWHARLPIVSNHRGTLHDDASDGYGPSAKDHCSVAIANRKPTPNLWTVMQKWILALPAGTDAEKKRKSVLQKELERSFHDLDSTNGLGEDGLVFAHCDLLSANVIMLPCAPPGEGAKCVSFIDYEYATPCPAAFDIANHFAEWGGYDCDYNMLPTRAVRKQFLQAYLHSHRHYAGHVNSTSEEAANVEKLFQDVDRYRGMPGFYWGIWALIQAQISQIDFDYASYAEVRLGEYWAWRNELDGSRAKEGNEMPLRERRWAQES